jgi:hypothetical protein
MFLQALFDVTGLEHFWYFLGELAVELHMLFHTPLAQHVTDLSQNEMLAIEMRNLNRQQGVHWICLSF